MSLVSNSTKIQVNAVSGTLIKNYRDSFVVGFHLESQMAEKVLSEHPYLYNWGEEKSVVVIQTMLCGDMQVLCELMWQDDFDKMFKEDEEQ